MERRTEESLVAARVARPSANEVHFAELRLPGRPLTDESRGRADREIAAFGDEESAAAATDTERQRRLAALERSLGGIPDERRITHQRLEETAKVARVPEQVTEDVEIGQLDPLRRQEAELRIARRANEAEGELPPQLGRQPRLGGEQSGFGQRELVLEDARRVDSELTRRFEEAAIERADSHVANNTSGRMQTQPKAQIAT